MARQQGDDQPLLPVSLRETMDAAAPGHAARPATGTSGGMTGGRGGAPRELVEGSGPRLSTQIRRILRQRLRAAALILVIGFGLYLLRSLLVAYSPLVLVLQVVLTALFILSLGLLSARERLSELALRALEQVLFGGTALFFGVTEYVTIEAAVEQQDRVLLATGVKSTVLYIYALIVLYGMLIPNRWWRALGAVIPMALVPPAAALVAAATIAGFHELSGDTATLSLVSDNVLMLVMAVITAVFGTHVINSLREEAFAARQLGQYRLTRLLGEGGMGEVYLAEHQLLKRPCAIKVIRPSKVGDARAIERFAREVRSAARLSHWNSIEIFDYGRTDDGTFFYVMEYLPGQNLEELVAANGPLPAGRVIYFLRQLCDALGEAQELGLVHRDIKPSNVFAAYRGGQYDVAKLLDFGLVKEMQPQEAPHLTQEGDITGSPLYLSPEIAEGEPFDARSDIYSLGALAYYLLTGQPPFTGKNSLQVILAHVRQPVTPPSARGKAIPADLERIVLRCLAKSPGERFADARSLREALDECADRDAWNDREARAWWREYEQAHRTGIADLPVL